jgi:hypothetical protein
MTAACLLAACPASQAVAQGSSSTSLLPPLSVEANAHNNALLQARSPARAGSVVCPCPSPRRSKRRRAPMSILWRLTRSRSPVRAKLTEPLAETPKTITAISDDQCAQRQPLDRRTEPPRQSRTDVTVKFKHRWVAAHRVPAWSWAREEVTQRSYQRNGVNLLNQDVDLDNPRPVAPSKPNDLTAPIHRQVDTRGRIPARHDQAQPAMDNQWRYQARSLRAKRPRSRQRQSQQRPQRLTAGYPLQLECGHCL